MNAQKLLAPLALATLLLGCAGSPPPPDWKLNAVGLLEHYQARWLAGDTPAADLALAKSRLELAKTARLDLLARLELAACGTRIAALDFAPCSAFEPLRSDAAPADQTYSRFIAGQWSDLDGKLLPKDYQALVAAKEDAGANRAAQEIAAPLPRLIAAGLLLHQGRAAPATLALAVDTASAQGWRRPLLTWLEVEGQRALSAGDTQAAQQIQRRIDFARKTASNPADAQK